MSAPLTRASDPSRPLPATLAGRVDAIQTAVESLAAEQRRLERLGFEHPLARCHEQLRFWQFLRGLHALPPSADLVTLHSQDTPWPAAPRR